MKESDLKAEMLLWWCNINPFLPALQHQRERLHQQREDGSGCDEPSRADGSHHPAGSHVPVHGPAAAHVLRRREAGSPCTDRCRVREGTRPSDVTRTPIRTTQETRVFHRHPNSNDRKRFSPSQMQGQSPPAPIRATKKTAATAEEDGDEGAEQDEDGGAGQDIMDLLPRTDIG